MTNPPNATIQQQLQKLVELQKIDFEIYSFKRDLKEKPDVLTELNQRFEEKKGQLKKLEEKAKTLLLDRKAFELELQTKEGEIAKTNTQLSSLKTNKEYQAKMLEIENLKADKSVIEEKILFLFEDIDTINAQLEHEKKLIADEEKNFLAQKKEIDATIAELQQKVQQLQQSRSSIIPSVSPATLSRYERILENKGGLAIVPVKKHACGGCFINIPEQTINEIRIHDKFVICEACARILYLEDHL